MAKKSLLQEAIAEAKQVRAAAIQNATKELEENLTPSIKEMLAKKLEEDLDLNENDDENIEENSNSGFKEVKPKSQKVNEADDDEDNADDAADDADADAADADAAADNADAAADDADAAADDADAAADAADDADPAADDAADDETPLKDITLGDLKQIISDLVAASAAPAPGGDMGADMDPGDVEGMGDETAPGDPAASADAPVDAPAADAAADPNADPAATDDDDEIDISEILRELEEEEKNANKDVCPKCGHPKDSAACKEMCKENKANDEMPENQNGKEHHKEPNENGPSQDSELDEIKKENEDLKKEVKELKEGVQKLSKTLKDVNLLNSKLLYTSRLLRQDLSESQKVNVIKTLDEAKNPAEVKSLYKTLVEGLKGSKNITESRRGSASKPVGKSTANPNNTVDEAMVRRFQELAGIIKG